MKVMNYPEIRREAFIKAAAELFMKKGYELVSIRDVLDAVGDKTASPSVFYYYFPSKVALYQSCVQAVAQSYLSELQVGFYSDGKSLEEQLFILASKMENSLRKNWNLLHTGSSVPNRLFVLDMREQVTTAVSGMWSAFFDKTGLCSSAEAQPLARFLSGGIGELVYQYMLGHDRSEEAVSAVMDAIVRLVLGVSGFSDKEKKTLFDLWQKHRKEKVDGCVDRTD